MNDRVYQQGFSLIEIVMVIVLTSIIVIVVAIFLKKPIDQYFSINNRAELTDIADTALRRIGRDIRIAVPNSIRVGVNYIEFIPSRTGGRYRSDNKVNLGSCGSTGNELDFSIADDCFEITGEPITLNTNDSIIIGSTGSYSAYDNNNGIRRVYTGLAGISQKIEMTGANQLPLAANLPSQRFYVVSDNEQTVMYSCENIGLSNDNGTGQLKRYWHYGFETVLNP